MQALRTEPISLTANFLFCVSTGGGGDVCVPVRGRWAGSMAVRRAGVRHRGQAVMVYLFLREMPETMVTV